VPDTSCHDDFKWQDYMGFDGIVPEQNSDLLSQFFDELFKDGLLQNMLIANHNKHGKLNIAAINSTNDNIEGMWWEENPTIHEAGYSFPANTINIDVIAMMNIVYADKQNNYTIPSKLGALFTHELGHTIDKVLMHIVS